MATDSPQTSPPNQPVSANQPAEGLEEEHKRLQIAELQQKLRLEAWKVGLTAFGSLLLIVGLVVDRYKTVDQRRWEVETAYQTSVLNRMTQIATDYDDLYTRTLIGLEQSLARTVVFRAYMEAFVEKVDGMKALPASERHALKTTAEGFLKQLAGEQISIAEYTDVVALQQRWAAKKGSMAPDAELLFGHEIASGWRALAESAWDALNAKYNLASTAPERGPIEHFRAQGASLQTKLRSEIMAQQRRTRESVGSR
jgi:hypothetical protein